MANDEQDLGSHGVPPDPGYGGYVQEVGPTVDQIRKYALWATLMGGGAGIEYYFGYKHIEDDITCEDWRSRDLTWDYASFAHSFFIDNQVPFWRTRNADHLVGNPENQNTRYCLAEPGELYLVYLPTGGTTTLDLNNVDGEFIIQWFNPRSGAPLQAGSITSLSGDTTVSLGTPPSDDEQDWLIFVRKK